MLFCDLVGSTKIAAQLDPAREIVDSYHRAPTEAITRFGGYVAQYLGDGVMAYFGWPKAHDNAAESAARAGLAIIDQLAQLGREVAHAKLSAMARAEHLTFSDLVRRAIREYLQRLGRRGK